MADRSLVEAVGDIRLSDSKLNADLADIKRSLLRAVENLERDARVDIGVDVDEQSVAEAIGETQNAVENADLNASMTLDTDPARAELSAFQSTADALAPVTVDVDVDPSGAQQTFAQLPAQAADAGSEAASSFGTSFQRALSPIALATTGFLATSLIKGFARLTTIEDATAGLTVQLGSASEAAKVLEDVLGVVRGTPFNLDQFARAATNLISFGVEAEKVPRYLTAIGEAAATRGSQANEFAQRLSDVFGQVTAIGRISGDDIWSFSNVGVNALAILGNTFNKTTEEIQEMVSDGAIPAEAALSALSEGILNGTDGVNGSTAAFGGTMEALRLTLTGAIGGFESAVARFGAGIIEPLSDTLTKGFNAATAVVDAFAKKIGDALGGLADSAGVKALNDFFDDVPNRLDGFIDGLSGIGSALAPITAAVGALGIGGLGSILPAGLGGPFLAFGSSIGVVGAALTAIVATTPELRQALLPVLEDIVGVFEEAGPALGETVSDAVDASIPLFEKLIEVVGDLVPVFETLIGAVATVGTIAVPVLQTLATVIDAIPTPVIVGLVTAFVGFKAVQFVSGTLTSITTSLGGLATAVGGQLQGGLGGIATRIKTIGTEATTTEKSVRVATVAIAGAMSGLAAQSEDTTTATIGALGAIGSIATGFATGGPWGGAIAAIGVGLGTLAGLWQNQAEQAKLVAQRVNEVSDALIINTTEWYENADAINYASLAAGDNATVYGLLGESLLGAGEDGEKLALSLSNLGLDSIGVEGGENAIRILRQIGAYGDPDGDVSKVPEILASLNDSFGSNGQAVADIVSKYDKMSEIKTGIFQELGLAWDDLSGKQKLAIETAEEFQDQSEKTDLTGLITKTLQLGSAEDERVRTALEMAEAKLDLSRATDDQTEAEQLYDEVLRTLKEDTEVLDQLTADSKLRDLGYTEDQIAVYQRLSQQMGVPISQLVDLSVSADDAKAAIDAIEIDQGLLDGGDELALSFQAIDEAVQGVNSGIDILRGKLSETLQVQAFQDEIRASTEEFSGEVIANLRREAENAGGVSLSDWLIAGGTELSNSAFSDSIAPLIDGAYGLVQTAFEERGPAAAAETATFYDNLLRYVFVDSLGLSPEEANSLVDTYFNEDVLQNLFGSVQSAIDDNADLQGIDLKIAPDYDGRDFDQAIKDATEGDYTAIIATGADTTEFDDEVSDAETGDYGATIDIEANTSEFDTFVTNNVGKTFTSFLRIKTYQDNLNDNPYVAAPGKTTAPPSYSFNGALLSDPIFGPADGGIFQFFREGGITKPERHEAQIVPAGSWRLFGEPETGGEGYIPLNPAKRGRSTQILTTIADMFGLDVVPRQQELPKELVSAGGPSMSEAVMSRAVAAGVAQAKAAPPSAHARARYADAIDRSVTVQKIEVSGVRDPLTAASRVIRRLSDVASRGFVNWEDWED